MRTSLLIIIFVMSLFQVTIAQKKCRDTVEFLHRNIDSLKISLAEARREWQKCSDRSSLSAIQLSDEIKELKKSNEQFSVSQNNLNSQNLKLRDSLEQYKSASALLQKALADKDLLLRFREDNANALLRKFSDSLAAEIGPQCYFFQDKGDVFAVISDTLLLGGYFFVSRSGKLLLEKISKLLLSHSDRILNICTYADADAGTQNIWKQSNQKAIALMNVFESFKFPTERLSLQLNGNWTGKVNYKKPPIILEMKLE